MKLDTIIGDQIVLDTVATVYNSQEVFYRITFELKPNKEAEQGNYPSQFFTKCSREKITSFLIKIKSPNSETLELNSSLSGLDSTKHYKRKPFLEFDMIWHNFKNISDFIDKFNNCHPDVQQSYLQQYGLVLTGSIPILEDGEHIISSEISFSDNKVIKGELKVNGILK